MNILSEKFFRVEVPLGNCLIHEDPPATALLAMTTNAKWNIMRGIATPEHVFWWDAALAIHAQVAPYVGIEDLDTDEDSEDHRCFFIQQEPSGKFYFKVSSQLNSHPRLQRLLQNENIVLDT